MRERVFSKTQCCPGIGCSGSEIQGGGIPAVPDGKETSVKQRIDRCAARLAAGVQSLGVGLDPDVLMLPGGSVIALAFWLYEHRPKGRLDPRSQGRVTH
jgi:hypothetical protein